jgi:predicted nucleic acid-binding protein
VKILLDTNVVLDLLLDRKPYSEEAREIFRRIERGIHIGYLAPTTVTTIHYLSAKSLGRDRADEIVGMLLRLFEISRMDREVLREAAANNGTDFEDSVIYTSALASGVDRIVTRDKRGFARSKVEVVEPGEFLSTE